MDRKEKKMLLAEQKEEPPSTGGDYSPGLQEQNQRKPFRLTSGVQNVSVINGSVLTGETKSVFKWIGAMLRNRNANSESLREAIQEYIVEAENDDNGKTSNSDHERALLSNILALRDTAVVDIMIPRADIVAIDLNASQEDLLKLLSEKQNSRLPVFRNSLDEVIGTIHIKDILACLAMGKRINIQELVRDVPIVSPAMPILDLLLMFRQMRKHMALVVDEFGGIDGLITIGDVIEVIVGEIDDEYDQVETLHLVRHKDGSITADARIDVEAFEKEFGYFLEEDEREDVDTIGGLIFSIAGRVPARGEILTHPSGIVFEIVGADPRRVNRVHIRNLPASGISET